MSQNVSCKACNQKTIKRSVAKLSPDESGAGEYIEKYGVWVCSDCIDLSDKSKDELEEDICDTLGIPRKDESSDTYLYTSDEAGDRF